MTLVIGSALAAIGPHSRARAYVTAADLVEYPDDARIAWRGSMLRVDVFERVPEGVDLASVLAELELAARGWNDVECPAGDSFMIQAIGSRAAPPSPSDGIATVRFVESGWAAEADAAATSTVEITREVEPSGRETFFVSQCDILVNAEHFRWSGEDTPVDLRTALTHELGHCLGLGHTSVAGALMEASVVAGGSSDRGLQEDDRLGYCALYETRCPLEGCGEGRECVAGECVASCGSSTCEPGAVCIEDLCTLPGCAPGTCGPTCEASCPSRRGDVGDPCTAHDECLGGLCGASGLCTSTCDARAGCAPGFECTASECEPILAAFGTQCRYPSECAGDLCVLEGAAVSGFCSRACDVSLPSCPLGHLCAEVDLAPVCVPEPAPDSGCSTASPSPVAAFAVAMLLLFLRRRLK